MATKQWTIEEENRLSALVRARVGGAVTDQAWETVATQLSTAESTRSARACQARYRIINKAAIIRAKVRARVAFDWGVEDTRQAMSILLKRENEEEGQEVKTSWTETYKDCSETLAKQSPPIIKSASQVEDLWGVHVEDEEIAEARDVSIINVPSPAILQNLQHNVDEALRNLEVIRNQLNNLQDAELSATANLEMNIVRNIAKESQERQKCMDDIEAFVKARRPKCDAAVAKLLRERERLQLRKEQILNAGDEEEDE